MTSAVPAVPGTRPVPDDRSVRASTSPFAPRYRAVTWGMLTLIALTAFEALAVTTVMPAVVDSLGGVELYAMAFAAPVASGVVGLVAAGGWADRRGPARPLLTGVVLFVLGLAVAGTARVMEAVVAGRVVQGLGAGMLTVALYVIVARVFPDESQPRVLAAFAAAWVVPALVGPAVAGLVADHLDWRWVFLALPVLAVPAVLALRPAVALVAGPRPPEPGAPVVDTGPDWRRLACALTAGTAALGLHVADQLAGALTVVVVVVVLVALAVAVPPLLPRGTLRLGRGLPSVVALRGLVAAGFFSAELYLPLALVTERGLSKAQAGLALTVGAVLWSLGSWWRGRAEGRWSDVAVLRLGTLSVTGGIACAALAVTTAPVGVSIVGWGLGGLGMGLVYPTLALLTLRLSPLLEQGRNTSSLQISEALTVAVVLAVSGAVYTTLVRTAPLGAFVACFTLAAGLALAAAALAGRVAQRT